MSAKQIKLSNPQIIMLFCMPSSTGVLKHGRMYEEKTRWSFQIGSGLTRGPGLLLSNKLWVYEREQKMRKQDQ
jgi:hypothetical protein